MESLYQPLPDIDAYLNRIGIDCAHAPSPYFLDQLIYQHQCSIPFENLDVYEKHLSPSLAKIDLFNKIVLGKRGGYCFELNALFGALLSQLGFKVTPCMARLTMYKAQYPMISHRANIVDIEGQQFLADVGFGGPSPSFALCIQDGFSRAELGQTFIVRKQANSWWDINYCGTSLEERPTLRICTQPSEEHDFIAQSFFQSQDPESAFRKNRIINIRTKDGSCNLRNTTLTERKGEEVTVTEIDEVTQLDQVLQSKFGIVFA